MKILSFIFLLSLFVTPSFAASQKCVDNFNKTLQFYNEGRSLFMGGGKSYEEFETLKDMVTRNKGRKRHTKFNRLEKTIEAVELLNKAISQTQAAKEKFEAGNRYNMQAQKYCDGENYTNIKKDYDNAQEYLKKIEKRLTGKDQPHVTTLIPDYSRAKTDLLDGLIRHRRTKSAIYIIENENIDLNRSTGENSWSFLHTATARNAGDIAKALVAAGADINQQTDQGYTPLMLAAINGNDKLFIYFFEHNASPFLLTGFKADDQYRSCNLVDLVTLAKTGHHFTGSGLDAYDSRGKHQKILDYLQDKGLVPVCHLNPVVATVNGEKIFRSDVDFIFDLNVRPKIEANPNQKPTEEQKAQIRSNIRDYLILQKIQVQLAKQSGLTVDAGKRDKLIQASYNNLSNINKDQLKQYINNEMLVQLITQREIIDHIKIPEQELHRYYQEHPGSFQQPETICARHIVVKNKEDAQHILDLVKKDPENFGELAKQYSTGPSANNGGDLGCFNRDKMVEEFSAAAFALDAGEISDVVQTQFGYHIIKVTSKTSAETVPFDEIRDNLEKWFKDQQAGEKIKKWQEELLTSADVKIMDKKEERNNQ